MTYGSRGSARRTDKGRRKESDWGSGSLRRLAAAIVLFLLCFVGKTKFPAQTEPYWGKLAATLSSSTDFRSAFTDLGQELSQGNDMLEAVGDWCVAVFAPGEIQLQQGLPPGAETMWQQEQDYFIHWDGDAAELRAHLLPWDA